MGKLAEIAKWKLEIPDINEYIEKKRQEISEATSVQQQISHNELTLHSIRTAEVVDRFLASKQAAGLAEDSIENYRDMLNAFARQYPILPTTPEPIEEFLTSKMGQTRFNYYSRLVGLYKFASQRLGLPNPMEKIEKPRFKSKEPDSLNKKQARELRDAIANDRERGLVYLYLGQAFRLSEALRLNVGDIRDDTILVHGKERVESIPLLPEVRDVLLKLSGGRSSSEPVFLGQRGRLGADMAQLYIKRLFRRAEIDGVKQSPHTLRHTFATLATIAGCDTYSVARLMHHQVNSRTSMTVHYIHLNLDDLRVKLERYSPLRLLDGTGQTFGKNI